MRRRILFILALPMMLAAAVWAASPALADSPHFINASASLSGTNLIVSWKEAGLGTNTLTSYTTTADATATFVCVNKGGANPSASNKTTINGPVSASGTFPSGKNGNVTASLTLMPPGSGGFSCPPGQTMAISQVTYSNVTLTDTTNGIQAPLNPGPYTTGCLLPHVRGAC
jgi:hypothetical protein